MKLTDPSRDIWLWLFHDGGAWTASDIAQQMHRETDDVFWRLSGMERRGVVVKMAPSPGCRRLRYAVTGTCLVPNGMCVAEVQANEDGATPAPSWDDIVRTPAPLVYGAAACTIFSATPTTETTA